MKFFLRNIKKYFKFSLYSAFAELKSEISKSYLSWLWWIINPLAFMLVYIYISVVVFKRSEPFFPVFVFIGLLGWDFFHNMLISCVKILNNNKSIISKVYIPKYILVISKSFTLLFKSFVSLLLIILLMFIFKVPLTFNILYFIPIMFIFYILVLGLSFLIMHFGLFIEDLQNVLALFLRILFYFSGIFYNINTLIPNPYKGILTRVNPVTFFITEFRKVLLYGKTPSFKGIFVWGAISIFICFFSIKLIHKYENTYAKVI